jgi:hydroxymethylbilane synthase
VETVVVETTGDKRGDVPIHELGGQGVFVKEVQAAVLEARADLAVHSAKDLPSLTAPGLVLAAVPEREDPRDALVGSTLAALPAGATVATGSVRRRAQLAAVRPDLTFAELRGNIDTRLTKAGSYGAAVIALAALRRLGRQDAVAEVLDTAVMLPQVSQGALAVECREGDEEVLALLAAIEHRPSRVSVDAERAFLAELGGGCDVPVGALATLEPDGKLRLEGLIATFDGRMVLRAEATGPDPHVVGRGLARHLIDDAGGSLVLEDLGYPGPYEGPGRRVLPRL